MAAFWPGPLTLILPRRPGAGAAAAGGQDSIGLRVPSHPVAQALLRACAARGVAGVAAPSANRFGRVSPTTAAHVADEFGDDLLVLDGGACEVGIESAIVDCTRATPALLRPGGLDRTALEAAIGHPLAAPDAASPRASGTLEAHYAPRAKVVLFDGPALQAALGRAGAAGGRGIFSAACSRRLPGWCTVPCHAAPRRQRTSCLPCCAPSTLRARRRSGSKGRRRVPHGTVCVTGSSALRRPEPVAERPARRPLSEQR